MDWNKGFSAEYYASRVDPASWRDVEDLRLTGGTVSRGSADLMESANIEMTEVPAGGEIWMRVYLIAHQAGETVREAIFTGLTTVPAVSWDGRRKSCTVECYSVLKPAADVLLQRGWYAPAGVNGAETAAALLAVGAAPVTFEEGSRMLTTSIVAEDGETNLSMARRIIDAIEWRLRITGDGSIDICPKAAETSATFDAIENDCVELSVSDARDWFGCPNVFRAIADDLMAVARDDDPDSLLSTVSRGREIWMEQRDCDLNDGETIAEYAMRRLKEEQSPARTITYARRFDPSVTVSDLVRVHHPAQEIDSVFRVVSQDIELSYGARTTEEAEES